MRTRNRRTSLAALFAIGGWITALNLGIHLWMSNKKTTHQPSIIVQSPPIVANFPQPTSVPANLTQGSETKTTQARVEGNTSALAMLEQNRDKESRRRRSPRPARRPEDNRENADVDVPRAPVHHAFGPAPVDANAVEDVPIDYLAVDTSDELDNDPAGHSSRVSDGPILIQASGRNPAITGRTNQQDQPQAKTQTDESKPGQTESQTDQPEPQVAQAPVSSEPPVSAPSSLLSQLGRAQERAAQSAAPGASGVESSNQSSAVDTTQLARQSTSAASISGVRRSPVSIQPTVHGYQQQQIYGQYQGANFVPVRFDFDSILSNVDPGLIDNLIIIPGPYGVKYGPGLSFIDVVATLTPRYDCPEWHSRTNFLYQTNGEQFYGRETIYGGGQDYGMRVSYGHKIGSDYQSGDDTNIPGSYNVRDVNLALGIDFTECSKLEIEYLTQDLTDTEYSGLIFDAEFRRTDAVFLRYTCDDMISNSKLLVEAWYNRTNFLGNNLNRSKQYFYRDNLYFNAQGMSFFPVVAFVGFTEAQVVNSGFRIAPTWGPDDGLQIMAGIDFHYVQQQLDEFDDFTDNTLQFSPVGFDNFPVLPSESIDPGMFIEVKLPVDDDLKLTAGARVDWVRTNADARHRAISPDGTRPLIFGLDELPTDSFEEVFGTGMTKHDVLMAMFLSADYTICKHLDLRMGFGHGQRPPSLTERYAFLPFLTVIQDATNAPLGDPNLDPEKASQFDLALVGNFECVRFRAAGFCSMVEDFISFDYIFFPTSPDVPTLVFSNTHAVLAGFEFGGEFDLAPCLTSFVNMSLVDGRDLDRDSPLPSIAPFQSRIGIRLHDSENKVFGVEFAARIVEKQDRIAATLFEQSTPGFTTFDLRAWWQINKHLRLTGGIDNLTDKNYLEHLSVHAPRVLEPGINFYIAMQIDF